MGSPSAPASFEQGVLLGILIGEGHFGGDGKQPQLTLKLHVRHESLLRYLLTICPGGRLYGPYHHGERHYFQLMYRGKALRDQLVPRLDALPWAHIDPHSFERYASMKARYARFLAARVNPMRDDDGRLAAQPRTRRDDADALAAEALEP